MVLVGYADTVASAVELLQRLDSPIGEPLDENAPPAPSLALKLDAIVNKLGALERRVAELEAKTKQP